MVSNVHINCEGRVGLLVDENPQYRRVLRTSPGGIDIVKVHVPTWNAERWQPLIPSSDVHFAFVFGASETPKTERAARHLLEVINMSDLSTMSLKELTAEYNTLTGRSIKEFKTKAAAIDAINKAKNVVTEKLVKTAGESVANGTDGEPTPAADAASDKETTVKTKTKKTTSKKTPAKKTTAKKTAAKTPAKKTAAKPTKKTTEKRTRSTTRRVTSGDARVDRAKRVCSMKTGAGALILKLLREGKDYDAVLSKVLKEFPDNETKQSHVSWYQSMRRLAGEKVKD